MVISPGTVDYILAYLFMGVISKTSPAPLLRETSSMICMQGAKYRYMKLGFCDIDL